MRGRIGVAVIGVALLLSGCGASGNGAHTRQVLVDYSPDDFPASFFGYFPRVVEAHPGDTIDFHQTWTGEPHTITLGTMLEPIGATMRPLLLERKSLLDDVDTSVYGVPSVFPDTNGSGNIRLNQTASQPCYVKAAPLPRGGDCPRSQPAFDGTQAFYNSGYIPYRGRKSNEFKLPLATTIKPGDYFYYCLLHGPGMSGFLRVKPAGASVASAKGLHDRDLEAGRAAAEKARRVAPKATFRLPGSDIQVGVFTDAVKNGLAHPVSTNQFFPSTFHAKVGNPVTWSFLDGPGHTVSFDVPAYLPALLFRPDGSVEINHDSIAPVGGPGYPETGEQAPANGFAVDVGNYDGAHFLSSGFPDGLMRYSITFSKPGTYPYACLIHPLMLGKVVVSA
jgi:plastocyanin